MLKSSERYYKIHFLQISENLFSALPVSVMLPCKLLFWYKCEQKKNNEVNSSCLSDKGKWGKHELTNQHNRVPV